jgi:predicted phage tail protein
MKIIKVYGELKKKLGQSTFELEVDNPSHAIKALCVNFPDLANWFLSNDEQGNGFKITVGKQKIYKTNLKPMIEPWSERDVMHITPVIKGAGRGMGQILAGALLIGLAVFAAPALGTGTGFLGSTGSGLLGAAGSKALGYIGTSLVFGGISQLLSPAPPSFNEASKLQSFSFSGIVNVAEQGLPVPICYGRVVTGSVVISAGLNSEPIVLPPGG